MSRQRLGSTFNLTVIAVALVVSALDALTKAWARRELANHADHVGPVALRLQYNSGISFSINRSGPLVTTVATFIIALVVVAVGLRARRGAAGIGFGLLIGGGVANVLDRLSARPHQVTDFIALGSFPVFNLADVAITAGFVTLIVVAVRGGKLLT